MKKANIEIIAGKHAKARSSTAPAKLIILAL